MAKKQLEDDLLTGGSVSADDKSAKKAAKAKNLLKRKLLRLQKFAKRTKLKEQN